MAADRIGHPKKRAFLAAYAESGNVSAACKAAGVARSMYYVWSEHDPAFTAAAGLARAEAADRLEVFARRWATLGIPTVKEVYERGPPIACDVASREPSHWAEVLVRREVSSDVSATLLIFLLKGAKPETYRERLDVFQTQVVKTMSADAWEAV